MYRELFFSFWKIGAFTIGGGYVMIPIMEQELVDRRGWLTREEFLDYMSLSQAMPGVFAVNMATCVGRRLGGMKGVLCAVLGNILMPIALILLLAMFFHLFRDNVVVDRIFSAWPSRRNSLGHHAGYPLSPLCSFGSSMYHLSGLSLPL